MQANGIMQNSKPFISSMFEIFNSHHFVIYLGQSLKSKRAWIQYLSGAFMAVWLKPLWTLIFIVFILLLFWSWDSLENSLRSWNHGVRKEKLLLFMIQLKYNFANNYELNGFYHSKIRPYWPLLYQNSVSMKCGNFSLQYGYGTRSIYFWLALII